MLATRSAATRERLLDAAESLLAEAGPTGTTLREIARRAGVSHAAPLRHWSSLADLLTAVATNGFVHLDDLVAGAIEGAGASAGPRARLAAAGRGYVEAALVRPGVFALMFRPDLLVPDDAAFVEASSRAFGRLVECVLAARQDGWNSLESPEVLAGALWASVHGVALLWTQGALQAVTGRDRLRPQLDVLLRALDLPAAPSESLDTERSAR